MAVTLLVTDRDCAVVGDPIGCWTDIEASIAFNTPGAGTFTATAYPWVRDQIDAAHRVVLIRDKEIFLAGPIEGYNISRSDDPADAGHGAIEVTWADDLSLIVARLGLADPSKPPEQQSVDAWTWTGNAERGLHALVNGNAGPGALAPRRVPRLVMGALAGVGTSVSGFSSVREPLGEVMRRLAAAGGGLGFRTTQVGRDIVFEVYAPADASQQVRFGFGLGNLRELIFERSAPSATTAIVGGDDGGEPGADSYILTRTDAAAEAMWGRREVLVGRPGNDPVADLHEAGDLELAESGEQIRLQTLAWETPDQRWPQHYDLGTRVSVAVDRRLEVVEAVRQVQLRARPNEGEQVALTIGSPDASADPAWVKRIRALERKIARRRR